MNRQRHHVTIDGNEAAAHVAHKLNEVIAIYPITPSSNMGELADEWSASGKPNLWGNIPEVTEMQSEGGAAGAVHGALQTGALATTFTASQGLLLMIPNMFKIAGELNATVFHVAARAVATHALSIFGDHSDVMATRTTGFAILSSNSVQEVMDFALLAHASTLEGRIPVLHFFDGFRTSHEITKIEQLNDDDLRAMIVPRFIHEHRRRALSPDHPVMRGSAQNPDVFFQARETVNPYYNAFPSVMQKNMDAFAKITGRQYRLYEYYGSPKAERVLVMMGSGAETAQETVDYLNTHGENVGLLKVRLFRPFLASEFTKAIPETVTSIAVLDRTKEPGSSGEPLYLDVVTSFAESPNRKTPRVIGGRFGLSSKEFTPAMVKAVLDELKAKSPKNHFTVGINDDVTHTSLSYDSSFTTEDRDVFQALFYGLGSDGTVGANKNSIKIIGEETANFAQGYFVYDSKKAGSTTVSHLRFGPRPIHSAYLISRADFVACHQWSLLEKFDILAQAREGATVLLNSMYPADKIWQHLPYNLREQIVRKKIRLHVIDGYKVAQEAGMGGRVNTIMQTCFFAISGVLPREEALSAIKKSIRKTYGKKGELVVNQNLAAVDRTLENLLEVSVPTDAGEPDIQSASLFDRAPDFIRSVTSKIIAGEGDSLPVSALPCDGTFPTGSAQWEKRNIAMEIPVWDQNTCIQCNKCVLVCPHATIRVKVVAESSLTNAPAHFKHTAYKGTEYKGSRYILQVAPEDCTGCEICVEVCPARNKSETRLKAINMMPQQPLREQESANYRFFLDLPEVDRSTVAVDSVKGSQFLQPLFEYSGACAGCGETPYLKLATQLFGDRMIVANATGCSSIYGGNLPTTPWSTNREGRGPAWSNSLFEDNAEFGLGMRLTIDKHTEMARTLAQSLSGRIGETIIKEILNAPQATEADIHEQRMRVEKMKSMLQSDTSTESQELLTLADYLVKKSVWIVGGDGWAYDIGFGGLDHVLASGRNVNILVLDTEVYSNTGGQMSKSTPRAAVAKFAAGGKPTRKKDLGLLAMTYRNVYVAQIAMGHNDTQTVRAFLEAEAYDGPSIIIAYSHCIAHGITMSRGMMHHKSAVESGHWPLYRYNPALLAQQKNPFKLDSKPPKIPFQDFASMEARFKMLSLSKPDAARRLMGQAQEDINERWKVLASMVEEPNGSAPPATQTSVQH